jgi:hypothetical protein
VIGFVHSSCVATLRDLDTIALSLPEVTKQLDDGRPVYLVHGKNFCFHRSPRPDALDPKTGERLTDVLVFRVDGAESKELMLADARDIFFTTPHWNGYPAVLVRIPDLKKLPKAELREIVIEGWLTRVPKRIAKAWLSEND